MESMATNNILSGYKVDYEQTLTISHLQFADDIWLLGEKSWADVRAIGVVLRLCLV